jgi:hypothetical protein
MNVDGGGLSDVGPAVAVAEPVTPDAPIFKPIDKEQDGTGCGEQDPTRFQQHDQRLLFFGEVIRGH